MKSLVLSIRSAVLKYLVPIALVCLALLGFSSIRRRAQAQVKAPERDRSKEILVERQAEKTDEVNKEIRTASEPVRVVVPKEDASVDELIDTYNKL